MRKVNPLKMRSIKRIFIKKLFILIVICACVFLPRAAFATAYAVTDVSTFAAGYKHTLAIKSDGSLWAWGNNEDYQIKGEFVKYFPEPVKLMDNVTAVDTLGSVSAAIKTDGSLWVWGNDEYGRMGGGWSSMRMQPEMMLSDAVSVSVGGGHIMAIKSDGSLWGWGYNENGQIGNGGREYCVQPVKVMDQVVFVTAGTRTTHALKSDGSLWAWGRNDSGEVGDGKKTDRLAPVKIMDQVLRASSYFAIKQDGSLWVWGSNNNGRLGDGALKDRPTPFKLMDDVVAASMWSRGMALKSDGSLWVWGDNSAGTIGDGKPGDMIPRKPLKILDNVDAILTASNRDMAIKTDGSLWAWGHTSFGAIGDGSKEKRATPVKIMDNIIAVKAGRSAGVPSNITVGMKSDGSLWTWGNSVYSQEGRFIETLLSPIKILDDVKQPSKRAQTAIPATPATPATSATPSTPATQATPANPASPNSAAISVLLYGAPIQFDQPPILFEGRVLVPMRKIFEALGATVFWDSETQTVTADKDSTSVSMGIGDNVLMKNGQHITLDVPARLVDGRTLVPARVIAESFGLKVEWDSVKREVLIY